MANQIATAAHASCATRIIAAKQLRKQDFPRLKMLGSNELAVSGQRSHSCIVESCCQDGELQCSNALLTAARCERSRSTLSEVMED
jgi:hypothetical protein